jgi:hypothetical protein
VNPSDLAGQQKKLTIFLHKSLTIPKKHLILRLLKEKRGVKPGFRKGEVLKFLAERINWGDSRVAKWDGL